MRTCYGHIAGKIGVKFTEALLENDYLKEKEECYKLTQNGKNWLKKIKEKSFEELAEIIGKSKAKIVLEYVQKKGGLDEDPAPF